MDNNEADKYKMLKEELLIQWYNPHYGDPDFPLKTRYLTSDGTEFKHEHDAKSHQDTLDRENYYNHLLEKRTKLEKFFNVKPDMSFYDEMQFKMIINRFKK